jgi:hypothetical protein
MADVTVKLNGKRRRASVVFAKHGDDFAFVDEWKDKLGDEQDTVRRDALDLAQLAIEVFQAHSRVQQTYVSSVEEIGTKIKDNEHIELAGFVLLKCDWFPDSSVIGICHFRRTWCNSITLDYLAAHPFSVEPPEKYAHVLEGVGSALLWFISDIARRNICGRIWGEATHGSSSYYKRIFYLESVEDLILVPPLNYLECAKNDLLWRAEEDTNKMKTEIIEELYRAEAENPPLIGKRSFVVSPSRKLAYHFLDLPTQVQKQIAKAFGLPGEGEEELRDDLLFRALFRKATENKKLADLWVAVEKMHEKGRPDENPFQ